MALTSAFHFSLLQTKLPKIANSLSFAQNPRMKPPKSLKFDRILTADNHPTVTSEFYTAIRELEGMTRDPSDVLNENVEKLSSHELQLVLVYFAQEGRDSYCALEVFDFLKKENKVDSDMMELMVVIGCDWIERLIGGEHEVSEVVGLLNEMECVGVEPGFSMVEKVVSLYWEKGMRESAVRFVEEVVRRGGVGGYVIGEGVEELRGGIVGFLAWKMMADGNYMSAVKLVIEFKASGLKPELYSYFIALTALVKEQKEFSKALRKIKTSIKSGLIEELGEENTKLLDKYQSDIISSGVQLAECAIQEGGSAISKLIHEKLLALYTCAGHGLKAEQELWQMKLSGKEPDKELCDVVLAICASQKEDGAVKRLLARTEYTSFDSKKKTLSWLLRGYVKGGYYVDASETLMKMLDLGFCPDYVDRVAVLQGLGKSIKESGSLDVYLKLCKRLTDMELIGPCLVYLYIDRYKLWIVNML